METRGHGFPEEELLKDVSFRRRQVPLGIDSFTISCGYDHESFIRRADTARSGDETLVFSRVNVFHSIILMDHDNEIQGKNLIHLQGGVEGTV